MDKLADYPDIKLILSLRTTFIDTVIPDLFFEQNKVVLIEHVGFGSETFNAIAEYCDYFEIAPPAAPIFGEEYENPLFLKLVCSRIAKTSKRVFAKNYTLGEVLESYLEDINSKISEAIYLDYDKRNNLVSKAIEAIVSHEEFKYGFLPYGCAYQAVRTAVKDYCDSSSRFLTALIDESLLICSQRYEDDEAIILFSFERIGDYYKALSLLPPTKIGEANQRDQIMRSKKFSALFDSGSSISLNQGVLEALAVILPEKYGIELYEITPKELVDNPHMIDHYVQGLSWRLISSLKEDDKRYIDTYVWRYSLTSRNFMTVLIRNSIEIESAFNADYLYMTLARMTLLTRDAIWTTFASESEELERLVGWLWDNYEKLPDNFIELAEALLAWCLTSTKRFLRDCATKAIACLLVRKPSTASSLLKRFIGIDDMYVVERILAAIYGAISHTRRDVAWIESSEVIYDYIFSPQGTYPHVLVRDYAYSIVSSAVRYHNLDAGKFERINPPYKSDWYRISPTNDDIDKFQAEVEEQHGKRSWQSGVIWHLIHSMTTEYGRGTCAYGDFGRYVFGSNVHEWNNQFNEQCLSNIVTWEIVSQDHFLERFGEFDYSVARSCGDRYDHAVERIGKKYQWIGMFKLIARLVDNYPPYTEKKVFTTEYIEYRDSKAAKLFAILSDNDVTSSELEEDSRFDNEEDFVISAEKNYLSNAEITSILIDLRNIDPSFIWKEANPPTPCQLMPNYFASIDGQEDWAKGSFIYSDLENHRIFKNNDRQYISLYTYVSQKKGTESRRGYCDESLTWSSAACFMRQEDIPAFNESYLSINGGSAPTTHFFHCFLYDHFDGLAYKSQMSLHEKERSKELPEFSYATQEYFWEAYNDSSLGEEASVDIMLPSEDLTRYFNLCQVGRGRWVDSNGDTICFDSNSLGYKEKMLLFDMSSLKTYLTEKKLALVWGEYFDKTSSSTRHEWWRTVHMSNDSFLVSIIDEIECDWDPKLY